MLNISVQRTPIHIDPKTLPSGFEKGPIYTTQDMLGEREFSITYSAESGLLANVTPLKADIDSKRLLNVPIARFPVEIARRGIYSQIIKIFQNSYLKLINGPTGTAQAVEVFPSLKGGMMTPKIPVQPGIALGSLVNGETISKMNAYTEQMAQITHLEQLIQSIDQRMKAIEYLSESELTTSNQVEKKRLDSLKTEVTAKITALANEEHPIPIFSSLQVAMQSPLDLERCNIVNQPKSFDSMQYRSQYVDFYQSENSLKDQIHQASNSGTLSAQGGWTIFSASASVSRAKSTADRISSIKKSGRSNGVLVVDSYLTKRNVRGFSSLKYDKNALERFADIMANKTKLPSEEHQDLCKKCGISIENGEPVIYIVTETVLGGSFTALVTFLKESSMSREAEIHSKETTYSGSIQAGIGSIASVGASLTRSNAQQSESDFLKQIMSTKIEIEFISQGAIPGFARNVVEKEIIQHLSLNPAQFTPSHAEKEQAQALISATGSELATLQLQRKMHMENVQVATINACRGLTETKEEQKVHTPESVLGAYENFAKQMSTDTEAGVPIGFNFTRLTLEDIQRELNLISRNSEEPKGAAI